jgi:ABC-type transport system involved in multi-copper enzyme maturation permease subunit
MQLSEVPQKLKNKWIAAILVFVIWMLFFDRNSVINQIGLVSDIHEAEDQKEFYIEQFYSDSIALGILKNDTSMLEKFGREKYLMKKPNEDIFLFVKDK